MSEQQEYVVAQDGFVLGRWRKAGERVALTPAQAEWELRAGRVRPADEMAEVAAEKRKAKRKD